LVLVLVADRDAGELLALSAPVVALVLVAL
jgi:hypothetical protein